VREHGIVVKSDEGAVFLECFIEDETDQTGGRRDWKRRPQNGGALSAP